MVSELELGISGLIKGQGKTWEVGWFLEKRCFCFSLYMINLCQSVINKVRKTLKDKSKHLLFFESSDRENYTKS